MVGGKVDGQILFGARSEKPKILFGARVRNGKIYLVPNDSYEKLYLAVKGLTDVSRCKSACVWLRSCLSPSCSSHLNGRLPLWEGLDSNLWPSEVGHGHEVQFSQWYHSMADVKLYKHNFFTFSIFTKVWPVRTIVTYTDKHVCTHKWTSP